MIDIRSDTVTRPTKPMLEAMLHAQVGDDVFGDDESVNALQTRVADLFAMDAALFCPTGTMSNQIAIKLHTQPGDEVICHQLSHVYLNEGGGIAFHSSASVRLLQGDHGRFTAEEVNANVNARDDSHVAHTRLVVVENTVTRAGGACWPLEEIRRIREVCDNSGLALHLDGARLFNALVAKSESARQYGALFNTVSVCLSKGLGAPAGSLIVGSHEHIAKAHRLRKLMGGGMRQAGYLAAAGTYALDHNIDRLVDDHHNARAVEQVLKQLPYVHAVLPVETNIVIFLLADTADSERFLEYLSRHHIKALRIGKRAVRFVFHLDVNELDARRLTDALRAYI